MGKKLRIRFEKYCSVVEKINFFNISGKILKNALVFGDYDHQKFIFKQSVYDIQNPHKKLHRIT